MDTFLMLCLAVVLSPGIVAENTTGDVEPLNKVVYVRFTSSSDEFMRKFATNDGTVPKEKKKQAVDDLIKMTKDSQKEVIQAIESHNRKYSYQSFWVINMIALNDTDSELLAKITEMKDVKSVDLFDRAEPDFSDAHLTQTSTAQSRQSNDAQWNIKQLNVPEVWATGIDGSGVVVGTIHYGAFVDNTLIRHNFRGDFNKRAYGFYEPGSNGCGHAHYRSDTSTSRVGLAVARNGYGVAPKAIYMLCSALIELRRFVSCIAWTICPHNGGNVYADDVDCTKAPAAVSVSAELDSHRGLVPQDVIDGVNMMTLMGITVITDAGRIEGNPCRRISAGCMANVSICVGFTNQDGKRSRFSACGPGPGNSFKPDILVPGYQVVGPAGCHDECPGFPETTCLYTDEGYISGAGHALGVVALMVQKNPRLTPARIRQILIDSSKQVEDEVYQCCGDLDQKDHPNYCSGYGLLDAKKAVDSA